MPDPRFRDNQEPAELAPVAFWQAVTDPTNQANVKAIQRDQRRQDMRELQAVARDLTWLIDRIVEPFEEGVSHAVVDLEKLDQIRRTTRKLITLAERRAAA